MSHSLTNQGKIIPEPIANNYIVLSSTKSSSLKLRCLEMNEKTDLNKQKAFRPSAQLLFSRWICHDLGKTWQIALFPFSTFFYLLSPAKNEALDVDRQVSTQAANLGTTHFLSPRITCFMVFKGNRGGIILRQQSVRGEGGKEGGEGGVHNVIVEPYGLSKFCQNFIVCSPPPH